MGIMQVLLDLFCCMPTYTKLDDDGGTYFVVFSFGN
jgi:hypothetical protein